MRCVRCRKKTSVCLDCKFCKIAFCSHCIQPETHLCSKIETCINKEKLRLKEELESRKCEAEKVVRIEG